MHLEKASDWPRGPHFGAAIDPHIQWPSLPGKHPNIWRPSVLSTAAVRFDDDRKFLLDQFGNSIQSMIELAK